MIFRFKGLQFESLETGPDTAPRLIMPSGLDQ